MTVNKEKISDEEKGKAFKTEIRVEGSRLICELAGRLDTITAPELLASFNDNRTDDIKEITVDMAETEYISSAGLRVLLSMRKTLSGVEYFHIINYSDSIKEILKVTGFDQLFGMA
ncbi:MAG: STAS domain-containing protein [Lachnospiraceae bacterium]|nr:STAS domain-containing protein [Lachnospiraceae bacterium]